jgi:general secretion pathway protein D
MFQTFYHQWVARDRPFLGFASGSVKVTDPSSGKETTLPSLIGFLNFLKSFGRTNVLSTPSIIAMDNQEAEISVGDRVVTSLQTTQGTNGSPSITTPQLEDAEISLKIKPFISPSSNTIRMEILQKSAQLSTISVPKNFEGQVQPLAKRSIKTNIAVTEGDTVVLGGLMKDEEIETVKKVPLLRRSAADWLVIQRQIFTKEKSKYAGVFITKNY